jgi:hypothetical protein
MTYADVCWRMLTCAATQGACEDRAQDVLRQRAHVSRMDQRLGQLSVSVSMFVAVAVHIHAYIHTYIRTHVYTYTHIYSVNDTLKR